LKQFILIRDSRKDELVEDPPREFDESETDAAYDYERAAQDRAKSLGADWDIALVMSPSLDELKQSHGSYFFSVDELLDHIGASIASQREGRRTPSNRQLAKVSEGAGPEYDSGASTP